MRYYLETSAIRKLSPKLSTFASNSNVFTSSLVLFELISGMTERDYALRKMTIKRTLESGINIDFDSFDIKKYKCVGIEEDDIDGKLAKEMANIIINSTSFSELENERIFINSDIFSLADFTLFDKNLSETIVNLTNQAAEIFSVHTKEEKNMIEIYFLTKVCSLAILESYQRYWFQEQLKMLLKPIDHQKNIFLL